MPATPQRLYLMQVATLLPDHLPVPCYLITMSDGQHILVDSGLPPADQIPPEVKAAPGSDVIEQLARLDLQPEDIQLLICSHFDVDHRGRNAAFTQAEYIVQKRHYQDALRNPRFAAVRPQWDQPQARFRFVDGDTVLFPGLELIASSGHVPGHQSVLVRLLHTGAVLLTIDAVFNAGAFKTSDGVPDGQSESRASIVKLSDLAQRELAALVVFGHDAQQWRDLKQAPDYYD